ncbi:MAG: alpha/beta hydrolase [Hyphomicrobium sp.]
MINFFARPRRSIAGIIFGVVSGFAISACSTLTSDVLPSGGSLVHASAGSGPSRTPVALPQAKGAVGKVETAALQSIDEREPSSQEFDIVTVLWGTNRKRLIETASPGGAAGERPTPIPVFTHERSNRLTTGMSKITVPKKDRVVGAIPLPTDYTVLDVTLYKADEDPRVHFTIGGQSELPREDFVRQANAVGAAAKLYKGHAFVYVHGFWNSFEDSIFRTAQLAYDMGFDGAAYAYAWPSRGEASGYLYDKDSVDGSQSQFLEFLKLVSAQTNAKKIHVIAHSMGARLVVDTLFPPIGPSRIAAVPKLDQVILAAADIDGSVLKSRAAAVKQSVRTLTLYASNDDEALKLSKRAAGREPRVGELTGDQPFIMPGAETIDVSSMGTWVFLGANHRKFAEKAHVLKDIALLMKDGVHPPDVRFPVFAARQSADGVYWRYVSN